MRLFCVLLLLLVPWSAAAFRSSDAPDDREHFSHAVFDSLLQLHVSGGRVYYQGFDTPAFAEYRRRLAEVRFGDWSREEVIAFWLNAYNASVIANVLAHPGLRVLDNADGFFNRDSFMVAGHFYTLDGMVNEQLRTFGEPLVHFGTASGASGAPRLHNRAFRAATVKRMLRDSARKYLRSDAGAVLDVGANVLMLSPILERYRSDFEQGGSTLLDVVVQYVRETEAAYIALHRRDIAVRFLPFDWRLTWRTAETGKEQARPYDKPKKPRRTR